MTACKATEDDTRIFYVTYQRKDGSSGSYPVIGHRNTTLDLVWAGEKCWFMPGSVITVTDNLGNSKTFIKEK